MALELGGTAKENLAATKAKLQAPVFGHLEQFVSAGELPRWPRLAFEVVLLGPSHDACRRLLAGADLDLQWMRSTLPTLAWRSVAPETSHAR